MKFLKEYIGQDGLVIDRGEYDTETSRVVARIDNGEKNKDDLSESILYCDTEGDYWMYIYMGVNIYPSSTLFNIKGPLIEGNGISRIVAMEECIKYFEMDEKSFFDEFGIKKSDYADLDEKDYLEMAESLLKERGKSDKDYYPDGIAKELIKYRGFDPKVILGDHYEYVISKIIESNSYKYLRSCH